MRSKTKVMFSVCLLTGGPPRSRSRGALVKVQVKVWGPPWSKSRSRSGGPPGQGLGGPPGQGLGWGPTLGQGPGQGLGGPLVKVQVKVWGGSPSPGQGQGLEAPQVKVQVKVRGAPSPGQGPGQGPGGPTLIQVKVLGDPPIKVQVKVLGPPPPGQVPGRGPCQGLGGHPPCQGPKMWGVRAVHLLRSRRRTVLFDIIFETNVLVIYLSFQIVFS